MNQFDQRLVEGNDKLIKIPHRHQRRDALIGSTPTEEHRFETRVKHSVDEVAFSFRKNAQGFQQKRATVHTHECEVFRSGDGLQCGHRIAQFDVCDALLADQPVHVVVGLCIKRNRFVWHGQQLLYVSAPFDQVFLHVPGLSACA